MLFSDRYVIVTAMETPTFLSTGPAESAYTIVLAHGAGVAMDGPFMNKVCDGLAEHGLRTERFEFPYMAKRRQDGKKRGPDQQKTLLAAWHTVISGFDPARLIIGGKSLGGRMASMVAEEARAAGVICLGYPFHPPGKPERTRVEHLRSLRRATLILQGTRDPFGGREEVEGYGRPGNIEVKWVEDGEHNFIPRKKSGRTESQNLSFAVDTIVSFVNDLSSG